MGLVLPSFRHDKALTWVRKNIPSLQKKNFLKTFPHLLLCRKLTAVLKILLHKALRNDQREKKKTKQNPDDPTRRICICMVPVQCRAKGAGASLFGTYLGRALLAFVRAGENVERLRCPRWGVLLRTLINVDAP